MATLLDSEAQFRQRAQECRLSDAALRDLTRLGITSFGLLAYSFGQPGQNIADDAFSVWVRQEVNQAITLADSAALKRLLFESDTLVMASLKEQVVAPDSAASKKVPATERDSKMRNVKANLTGLLIEGPLDPGHSLLDSCAQMQYTNESNFCLQSDVLAGCMRSHIKNHHPSRWRSIQTNL